MRFIAPAQWKAFLAVAFSMLGIWSPGAAWAGPTGQTAFPLDQVAIRAPAVPPEALGLALRHFNDEVCRLTGTRLPVLLGEVLAGRTELRVGNRGDLADLFAKQKWQAPAAGPDVLSQSYVVAPLGAGPSGGLAAAGFGEGPSARAYLGASYALAELVRRLDVQDGQWAFVLDAAPVTASPAVAGRTLYHMNCFNASRGLSLDFMTPEEIEDYVDFLVDARYSRVSFFQWRDYYLYPGNAEGRRVENERIARLMRHFCSYARRRGLEAYQMVTPSHIHARAFLDDPACIGKTTTPDPLDDTGFLFYQACCWSRPEARAVARATMRRHMEYYGPLDGYCVWFWDPGGCFCDDCARHQADRIFDQFTTIVELAQGISPGARFEASLWPTWAFPNFKEYGLPFTTDEANQIARDFLDKARGLSGADRPVIMDGGEDLFTNLFNGIVPPAEFQRDAFVYRVLGQQGECAFPFALFRIRYLDGLALRAKENRLEAATLFTVYNVPSRPAVFAFADMLYERETTAEACMQRYAGVAAKGSARKQYVELLTALEDVVNPKPIDRNTSLETDFGVTPYPPRAEAVTRAEQAWASLEANPLLLGDREWLAGFVLAQRHYLEMARAADEGVFSKWYEGLLERLRAFPVYRDFADRSMSQKLCVTAHLAPYWRGPANDSSQVGMPKEATP